MAPNEWKPGSFHRWSRCVCETVLFEVFSLTTVSGTGGTVAGVGQYLKSMNQDVFVAIADPEGSGLYNKVMHPLRKELLSLN